eukprot:TRINITY_DN61203_c0_g1_i1.p1 TRINITY_DN61203_c0_g1~~TRINITY_DN61203_c0_g1_i1.p1  ORF type:complete len:186 (-),score=24.93 TRINITY_DN61203_c0_g1_i1:84-641(-)
MAITWRGDEAATFFTEQCHLPQYAASAQRNLSLVSLRELQSYGVLTKGLSRAGVCELEHQQTVDHELRTLQAGLPAELLDGRQLLGNGPNPSVTLVAKELLAARHMLKKGPKVPIQRGSSLTCLAKASMGNPHITREPPQTSTAKMLLKRSASSGFLRPELHRSAERWSPSPFDFPTLPARPETK